MSQKFLGYVRVSTSDQGDSGLSLQAQESAIRMYADLYKLEVVAIFSDTASAKTLNRPGIQEVIDLLKSDSDIQGVIIHKLDRLSRSLLDFNHLINTIFTTKQLISIENQIDTRSAAGRLCLNILMTIAQWEREAISERTKAALNQKKAKGQKLGKPPYGYQIIDGQLIPKPEEQEIIKFIRSRRRYKDSLAVIVDKLNAMGARSPGGTGWNKATVANILKRKSNFTPTPL